MNSLTLSQKLIYILSQNDELTDDHVSYLIEPRSEDNLLDYVTTNCSDEVRIQFIKLMDL